VQDGSSTIANRSSSTNAFTGHKETQAAQPKQRELSTTNTESGILATPLGRGSISEHIPRTPIFPLQLEKIDFDLNLSIISKDFDIQSYYKIEKT
tara:strand:+ start:607 stop:891 length:285 start_codon:yes stop_codon:yes gene_type:complete